MWYVDDTRFINCQRIYYTGHNNQEILDWAKARELYEVYELFGHIRVTNGIESIILQETEWLAIDHEGFVSVLVRSEKELMV